MVEDNNKIVKQREQEISHIVQSIGDLNSIFKDLSMLIIDQVRLSILLLFVALKCNFSLLSFLA